MTKTSHLSFANRQAFRSHERRRYLIGLIILVAAFGSVSTMGEERTLEIDVAGVTRSAVVFVPDDARLDDQLPLLLAFHGSSWNGRVMQQTTGFSELAEQEKFVVAYPNGSGPSNILSWNAQFCCSFALERGIDDLSFVDLLLDELLASYPVDPSRVYATGFSNGGMFTYVLAIERPEQFAAVAVVSGAMYATQPPANIPIPMLIIHGTNDSVIPYDGGWGALRSLSGKTEPAVSAIDAASLWIANNGCSSSEPMTSRERTARIQTYIGCRDHSDVVFITLLEGGHNWPVIERNESDFLLTDDAVDLFTVLANNDTSEGFWDVFEIGLDASLTIWEFFSNH